VAVVSCNYLFEACSACFDYYRVERTSSRAGVAPAEVQRLFTAHFYASNLTVAEE
jgi:hypothetical protein